MHLLNYGADLCLNSCLFTSFYKMTWVWKMTDLLNYQSEGSAFPFGSRQVHIWSNFHEICISEILIFYLVSCTFKLDVLKANLTHINCKTKKKIGNKSKFIKNTTENVFNTETVKAIHAYSNTFAFFQTPQTMVSAHDLYSVFKWTHRVLLFILDWVCRN